MKVWLQQPQQQNLSWLPPAPMGGRPQGGSVGHLGTVSAEGRDLRHNQSWGARRAECLGVERLMGILQKPGRRWALGKQPPSSIPGPLPG